MKYITINLVQRGSAFDFDQSASTLMYAMEFCDSAWAEVFVETDDWSVDMPDVYQVRACIEIVHPMVLVGSWEEVLGDFRQYAKEALRENGLVEYNDYCTLVWK